MPVKKQQLEPDREQQTGSKSGKEYVKAVHRLYFFFGSKIAADGDCSHESKRRLLLTRKAMTNLDSVLKSNDITLLTKVRHSQSYGFSSSHVQMWELNHKEG